MSSKEQPTEASPQYESRMMSHPSSRKLSQAERRLSVYRSETFARFISLASSTCSEALFPPLLPPSPEVAFAAQSSLASSCGFKRGLGGKLPAEGLRDGGSGRKANEGDRMKQLLRKIELIDAPSSVSSFVSLAGDQPRRRNRA